MYDGFSADYDRFVDWPARLATELPFIERELQAVDARRVLDAACGTGMHAIALARRGYDVVGADLSTGMIERARANAQAEGVDVRFEVAGFGELAQVFVPPNPSPSPSPSPHLGGGEGGGVGMEGTLDAVLCLGNSLPHVLTPGGLASALADFAACLRPGGLLLIQNCNFDAVLARGERWMEPQTHREGESEWLFLRFYDFESDGTLTFNLVTLRREGRGDWGQRVTSTRLWPLRRDELLDALEAAGFAQITCWGDMAGGPFEERTSGNLVATARRKK
jgi:glycine/sarcosine N-methyltransferase